MKLIIRYLLEQITGKMSDKMFRDVMIKVENNIRHKRIMFGQKTSIGEMLVISARCYKVVKGDEKALQNGNSKVLKEKLINK